MLVTNQSFLVKVVFFSVFVLFTSCSTFYMGSDTKETSIPGERVYSDLGRYDEDGESIYDYVADDVDYSKKTNKGATVAELNNSIEPYQDPELSDDGFDVGYKAQAKSINNYDYNSNGLEDSSYKSKKNARIDTQENQGFFSRIGSGIKNFFIIEEKSGQNLDSPKASLSSNNTPLHSNIVSKRVDWKGRLHFPVNHPEATLTSGFGWRKGKFHEGIDVSAPYGSIIEAAYDAKVLYSGDKLRGYGNMLVLQSRSGLVTVYSHNAKLYAKKGEFVKQGDVIALLGDSGNATAPHLHFEVRLANTNGDFVAVNPDGLFR